MLVDGGLHGARIDEVQLVVVDPPDQAAPLVRALDMAGVGAWMWVIGDNTIYFSRRVLDLLGLSLEPRDTLLKRFIANLHADDRPMLAHLLGGELPAGPFEIRYRFMPPDGPLRWICNRGRVDRAAAGGLVGLGGVIRDITDELGRELDRQESAARLEALVNALPFAVWARGGDALTVTIQNTESIAMWGDLRGSAPSEAPPEVREEWKAQLADVLTGQVVRTVRERMHDGERRVIQEICAPVVIQDRVAGAVGVAIDVTDVERARSRLYDALRLESLGVLAGGIAHDFNNLLTAILGNASLLQMELGTLPAVAGPVEQIEAAARRAAELCRQMLAYAGRGRFALAPLDVNTLISGMEPIMAMSTPNADLQLTLGADLPPVCADEAQLRQLLMNLVLNAHEALHPDGGSISIRTSVGHRTARELLQTALQPDLRDGEFVSIAISDTGQGMTSETVTRIFEPFFSTRFTGRGLGLAYAVGVVRAHKGALRVESRPGAGSTFELMLPADREGAAGRLPADASASAAERVQPLTGTVLIVDDEAGVRLLARRVLERSGMTVVLCEDGEQGVEQFRAHAAAIRVVLIDLTMPGVDGRETLRRIREISPAVPAIFMSGYTPLEVGDSAQHFLQKPFTPDALRTAVYHALGGAA